MAFRFDDPERLSNILGILINAEEIMRFHIDSKHAPEDCGLVNPTKESLWHQIGLKDAKN